MDLTSDGHDINSKIRDRPLKHKMEAPNEKEKTQRFREWAKLDALVSKIPKKYQHGFLPKDLLLTCLTCSCDSLVAGSNTGLVFWYDRSTQKMIKSRVDEHLTPITALSLTLNQYGEVLAVGNFQGAIAVFCSNVSRQKPVLVLSKVHLFAVTALAWDSDGQRLLSGDDRGRIILSQFKDNQLQPLGKLINESTAIIQLRFHPLLSNFVLASTYNRTVIVTFDKLVETKSVGEESRKVLSPYGADFGYLNNEMVIFTSQPGLDIQAADMQCRIVKTFSFGKAVSEPVPRTVLLSDVEECYNLKLRFGPLSCLTNNLIVTYSPSGLFVLDPADNSVISCCRFKLSLKQAAVFHDEIFLLVDGRIIIRLSQRPDRYASISVDRPVATPARIAKDLLLKNTVPSLQSAFNKLATKVSDLELHNIKSKPILGLNQGPLLLESLSNALGPIFSPEAKEAHESKVSRSITSAEASAASSLATSPISINGGGQMKFAAADDDSQRSICLTPPFSESGSSTKSPEASSPAAVDHDDLVYATVLGKDRRMKIKRKTSSSSLVAENSKPAFGISEMSNVYGSRVEVDTEEFREELERKEKLLADLLKLDDILGSSSDKQDSSPRSEPLEETRISSVENEDQIDQESFLEETTKPTDLEQNIDEDDDDFYSKYRTEDVTTRSKAESPPPVRVEVNDLPDWRHQPTTWLRSSIPCKNPLSSLGVCDNYIYCVEKNRVTFARIANNPLRWHHVDYQVDYLAVSCSGRFMWKVYKGVASYGDDVNHACPYAEEWIPVTERVLSVALDEPNFRSWTVNDSRAWLLHPDGSITCRNVRNVNGSRSLDVPAPVKDVRSWKGVLWILLQDGSVYARSGVSSDSPLGTKWTRVNLPSGSVSSIGLSHSTAWVVIDSRIFFMNRVTMESPAGNSKWFQIDIPNHPGSSKSTYWQQVGVLLKPGLWLGAEKPNPVHIAAHEDKLWVALPEQQFILTGENILGFLWEKLQIPPTCKWTCINASGQYRNAGALWLLGSDNKLYGYRHRSFDEISLPCDDISCIAASPGGCLWLLTEQGRIFIRAGMTSACPLGTGWTELSTIQFWGDSYPVSVSLGSDIAWACDKQGRVYMRTGSNESPDLPDLCPAWIHVDDDPKAPRFTQVYTSASNFMVWAIDEGNSVYVRQGIYPDLPIGISWVKIEGIAARLLTLSESSVWALAVDGAIYRRIGITRANFAGDGWEKIIGTASYISVSVDDKLFASAEFNAERAVCRLHISSPMNDTDDSDHVALCEEDGDEDWVLI